MQPGVEVLATPSPSSTSSAGSILRDRADGWLIAASFLPPLLVLLYPNFAVIGAAVWWTSNTVAHYFIHRRFFRLEWMNGAFQIYLTLITAIPQTLWKQRHLAHHAERPWRFRYTQSLGIEILLVAALGTALLVLDSGLLIRAFLPGFLLGLLLCYVHGYFEHSRGTTSHYGPLYNFLFFNDGFHHEHHQQPGATWKSLRRRRAPAARASRWPAILRFLDAFNLVNLECAVLRSAWLRGFVLKVHRAAFARLLAGRAFRKIVVVGGGLYPRTAMVLRDLYPSAEIIVFERDAAHIELARPHLPIGVQVQNHFYDGRDSLNCDLLVLPLALDGARDELIGKARCPVASHDWIWRKRGEGAVISIALLKRLNWIDPAKAPASPRLLHPSLARRLAVSVFVVALLAKAATLAGRAVSVGLTALPAWLWQDAVLALAFGLLATFARWRSLQLLLYAGIILWTALNIPVQRILSSPLTLTMLNATSGTLRDSIAHHVTAPNLVLMSALIGIAVWLPWALRNIPALQRLIAGAGAALLLLAPFQRVHTNGFERNAVVTLISSAFSQVPTAAAAAEWRKSPFTTSPGEDLTWLRAACWNRNVVLILLESTGAAYLDLYGGSNTVTPHLSTLARHSVLFENASAVYPESIKGLYSILFSQYPIAETKAEEHVRLPGHALPEVLRPLGYTSALFHSGRFVYLGMDAIVSRSGFDVAEDAGAIGGNLESSFGVDEPAAVKRMLDWIDSIERGRRFFLTYLPIAGHHPYETPTPGPLPEDSELNRYLNALNYGDAALGELITGLKARALFENTLFIVAGDHGEAFGQHDGNYGHTLAIFEENVHVPYLVAIPGVIKEPVRIKRPISLMDSSPTILDLLGVSGDTSWKGSSALKESPQMSLIFTDYSLLLVGLRDGRWKFIYDLQSRHGQLYDLSDDPGEKTNLADQHQTQCAWYARRLRDWAAAQKWELHEARRKPRTGALLRKSKRAKKVAA